MNLKCLNGCVLLVVAAVLCFPSSANAQMAGDLSAEANGSACTLSTGLPGATYTPFERLRQETITARKHAIADGKKQDAVPGESETEVTDIAESVFRVRTTRVYPQPNRARATSRCEPIYLFSDEPRGLLIREVLDTPAGKIQCAETPLRDVVAKIAKERNIDIEIDATAFADAGIDSGIPVTRSLPDVSLRSALRLLLDDLDLTYLITNGILLITTKDRAAEMLQTVLYPVPWTHEGERLEEIISNAVAPATWASVGGQGIIRKCGQYLCVTQTEEVHDQVRVLLERLGEQEFQPRDGSEAREEQRVATRVHPVIDNAVLTDLRTCLTDICNAALAEEGDAMAKVFVVGNRIVVQSSSRAFHVYAAEVITAFNGVEVSSVERFESGRPEPAGFPFGGMGMGGGMGSGSVGESGGGMF